MMEPVIADKVFVLVNEKGEEFQKKMGMDSLDLERIFVETGEKRSSQLEIGEMSKCKFINFGRTFNLRIKRLQ